MEALDTTTLWRALPILAVGWLAFFFGRTLRAGETPLIERIARVSDPALTSTLCRYTRRLTAVWCAYFVVAMFLLLFADLPMGWAGGLVWSGTIVLFVGEHLLRRRLFPDRDFPNLRQQVRDTCRAWRRSP